MQLSVSIFKHNFVNGDSYTYAIIKSPSIKTDTFPWMKEILKQMKVSEVYYGSITLADIRVLEHCFGKRSSYDRIDFTNFKFSASCKTEYDCIPCKRVELL